MSKPTESVMARTEPTLLELVSAVGDVTDDDREVVAVVLHWIGSGRLRPKRQGALVVAG